MSIINIVIPMAGEGSRFKDAGYKKPKPFIDGKPMIIRVLDNLNCENARFIMIVREDHLDEEKEIMNEIENSRNVVFHPISHLTEGAACTVLHARQYINNEDPLIIANSDQVVDIRLQEYVDACLNHDIDGLIMTFTDHEKNKKWSFAKVDSKGLVTAVREKEPISDKATVGIYMFKRGLTYIDAAIDMIVMNERVNNEFYVAPVFNYAIKNGSRIGVYDIQFSSMHGLGTPEDLDKYISWRSK